GVLSGAFYTQAAPEPPRSRTRAAERPAHYKVICISMYTGDLERLDEMVDALKAMGVTKANRSALIRHALSQVDLHKVPRGMWPGVYRLHRRVPGGSDVVERTLCTAGASGARGLRAPARHGCAQNSRRPRRAPPPVDALGRRARRALRHRGIVDPA